MKHFLLFFSLLLATTCELLAQDTPVVRNDFIVLKKRNNRTLKTYTTGSFISATTYNGFNINGLIKDIRNDSIFVTQQTKAKVPAGFGTTIDTLYFTFGFDFREIKQFNFTPGFVLNGYSPGARRGFVQVALPKLMVLGGVGYIILELVNTAYRNDSLTEGKKLRSLGIAALVAGGGILIDKIGKDRNKVGKRYKVLYIKKTATK